MTKLPTCLLFPGFMCDERGFRHQALALSSAGFPVHHARTENIHSVKGAALDALTQTEGPIIAIGLSMGAILAMEVAKAAPERLAGLILMDCNPWPDNTKAAQARQRHLAAAKNGTIDALMADEIIPTYCHNGPYRKRTEALCRQMAQDMGSTAFANQTRALVSRGDQIDGLRKVTAPTLVIMGKHDAVCPMDRHEAVIRAIPHSQFAVISDSGHLPTLEQPDQTTELLIAWITGL